MGNLIQILGAYALPLVEIGERKLAARLAAGGLPRPVFEQIAGWKAEVGIAGSDELEYKYFLEALQAITVREANAADQEMPLFGTLTLRDLALPSRSAVKMYYLSRLGRGLKLALDQGRGDLFEAILFWLIIRSEAFEPLLQGILGNPVAYRQRIDGNMVPSKDAVSRRLALAWLRSLGLDGEGGVERSKLAGMLLYSVILELDECWMVSGGLKDSVEGVCRYLSAKFSLPESAIDFAALVDVIFGLTSPECLSGFASGRGHLGLPSKPLVQLLDLKRPIPIEVGDRAEAASCLRALRHHGRLNE